MSEPADVVPVCDPSSHEFVKTDLFVEFRTEPSEWPPGKLLPVQMCRVCGVLRVSPENQTKVIR